MLYTYYRSPIIQTGEYLSLINPLLAIDKNTLIGTERKILNDESGGEYTVTAKRLRDNFSLINSDGGVFAVYSAKFD